MSLNDDLLKVVTANLPAMQVDALKRELERASLYDYHKTRIEDLEQALKEKAKIIDDLESFKRGSLALDSREAALAKREQTLEVQLLKKDVECLKDTNSQLNHLMQCAFRNTTQRKVINGNNNTGYSSTSETTEHD